MVDEKKCSNTATAYIWGGSGTVPCGSWGAFCPSCLLKKRQEEEARKASLRAKPTGCRHSNYRMTTSHTAVCEDCGETVGG